MANREPQPHAPMCASRCSGPCTCGEFEAQEADEQLPESLCDDGSIAIPTPDEPLDVLSPAMRDRVTYIMALVKEGREIAIRNAVEGLAKDYDHTEQDRKTAQGEINRLSGKLNGRK